MPLDLALTDAGYNPRTARYGFSKGPSGDVLFDSTQAFAVMTSVACVKNGWWANSNHGSDVGSLQNLTRITPSPTPSQAEASALAALEPLEQARLIVPGATQATARVVPALGGLSALRLGVSWQTPGGNKQAKTLP